MTAAPNTRYASGLEIERWIDSQQPLIWTVNAAVQAIVLGDPEVDRGPMFVAGSSGRGAHLTRLAAWRVDGESRIGFKVELYGNHNRIVCWGARRSVIVDCVETWPWVFANDLCLALATTDQRLSPQMPVVRDGLGGAWVVCRLGCDMHVVAPGRVECSCDEIAKAAESGA